MDNYFEQVQFDNSYSKLDARLYHKQPAIPLEHPRLGHLNTDLAQKLRLPTDAKLLLPILSGDDFPEGFVPLAMAYAGHQFGHWAGQLGDGRGLLIAQVRATDDKVYDLHLKGAGKTPYSRMGDGRAVLRSVIREYLAGHALNHLGVAASDALGFVTSDTSVRRETMEPAAMMVRVADTHVRLGHFEWIAAYAPELLAEFTDYVIDTYYPDSRSTDHPVQDFLRQVVARTAQMIADWQLVGFAHGVMNTDNLSITGTTIDFGPYGFLQRFQPDWINNHSDTTGRYTYQNQPAIAHWNLSIFLGQFLRLDIEKAKLSEILATFEPLFLEFYQNGIARKIGLHPSQKGFAWSMRWLQLLQDAQLDYTNSFRVLSEYSPEDVISVLQAQIKSETHQQVLRELMTAYQSLIDDDGLPDRLVTMQSNNPLYILRNHMAQAAIEQAYRDDFSEVKRQFDLLSNPYQRQEIAIASDTQPPDKDAAPIVVSCSS